jgi:hypothetical protein
MVASIAEKANTAITWVPIFVLMRLERGIGSFSLKATTAIRTFDCVFNGKEVSTSLDPSSCTTNTSGSPWR